jgi:ABC-type amino acid transport substrate-binding protein
MKRRAILLAAAAACAAGLSAAAQTRTPPDPLAGAWRFETGTFYGSCRLVGTMRIAATDQPHRFTCRFTAHQKCAGLADDIAEQVCTVTRNANQITITSKLVRVSSPGYAADNWRLTFKSPTLMTGHQWDSHTPRLPNGGLDTLPATFTRSPAPIS